MVKISGLLKTLGEKLGEKKDFSEWQEEKEHAVLTPMLFLLKSHNLIMY